MHNIECVTVKLISPTVRKRVWLQETAKAFSRAVQYGLNVAKQERTSNRAKLHNAVYRVARDFGLASDYARMSVNSAVSLARSYYELRKVQRRVSFPKTNGSQGIGLGINAYKIVQVNGHFVLRISTGKRGSYLWCPLCVPTRYRYRMPLVHGDAKLFQRGQDWYVSLPVRITITPTVCDGEHTFIGVDLGIVRHATAVFPDKVVFFNGKPARQKREHFADLRRRYQAHHRMDRVRQQKGKESYWMTDLNHKISRRLVDLTMLYPNPIIVLERLDGIQYRNRGSKKFNRMLASWRFRQLVDFIEYKTTRESIPVIFCDPRGTSKTCPKCGHATRSNRPNQSSFRCVACNFSANADYVAARNIAAQGLYALVHGPTDMARSQGQTENTSSWPDGVQAGEQLPADSNLASSL